jgi:uncharacterized protein involved in response to NO
VYYGLSWHGRELLDAVDMLVLCRWLPAAFPGCWDACPQPGTALALALLLHCGGRALPSTRHTLLLLRD